MGDRLAGKVTIVTGAGSGIGRATAIRFVEEGARVTCVDIDDPAGARRGIFAIQLHAGGPTEVRVKDIKLEIP